MPRGYLISMLNDAIAIIRHAVVERREKVRGGKPTAGAVSSPPLENIPVATGVAY